MNLDIVRKTFEKLGREDALYGVLTDHSRRHNKWDEGEFFATGVVEVGEVMAHLKSIGVTVARHDALDFGCGVGRLTQALAAEFDRVVGVDIADTMIDRAREFNKFGDRVQYLVNTVDDLSLLPSSRFDFIYSSITLQHIPPEASVKYMQEFFRLLRPNGVAVFQVHSGPEIPLGAVGKALYSFKRRYLRRAWKLVRGRAPYEMHYVPTGRVRALVTAGGARLADVVDLGKGRLAGRGTNFRYFAVKNPTGA